MIKYSEVSVIIPAYNEENGIIPTLTELLQTEGTKECEIIIVNDGSKDKTKQVVSEFIASGALEGKVKLISHNVNRGYGSAIATGTRASNGKIIAWYDSDGQHRPCDLLSVLDAMRENEYDYVIGIRGADSHVDKSRVLGKSVLKAVVNMLSKEPMKDFNSGMRAFKREVLVKYLPILPKRFGASTVTTFIMQEENYFGCDVPIVVRERVGKSSVKQIRDGFVTLSLIADIIILFRPMQIFGNIGWVSMLLGIVYSLVKAFVQHQGIPVLGAIVIIFGIQMFIFGILSSQISRARLEQLHFN